MACVLASSHHAEVWLAGARRIGNHCTAVSYPIVQRLNPSPTRPTRSTRQRESMLLRSATDYDAAVAPAHPFSPCAVTSPAISLSVACHSAEERSGDLNGLLAGFPTFPSQREVAMQPAVRPVCACVLREGGMSTHAQTDQPASPRLYILHGYVAAARTRPPQPPIPHQAVAQLFRLARGRHTFLGWLRFRLAYTFAPQHVVQHFTRQLRARYYTQSELR